MNPVRYFGGLAALVVVGGALHAADSSDTGEIQWRWEDVPRVVAFGDVHGAYDELVRLLQATEVVDGQLHWAGGKTHVVSVGDLIDRGPESRAVLDLLMRLQDEASTAGGRLHVVLGNHELMNMMADFRYVADGGFAAFADEEPPGTQDRALQAFSADHAELSGPEAEKEFLERYPPGYFGRLEAFSPTGRYGKWLLGLPILIVIDDTAFVHGGLSPVVSELGGAALNRELRSDIRDFLGLWRELIEAGVVAWHTDALTAADELAASVEDGSASLDGDVMAKAKEFVALSRSPALSDNGPLWYRGTAWCHPLLESAVLDESLARLGVERVAVGHSTTSSRRIVSRMNDRAILLDTGMLASHYHGRPAALVIEDENTSAIYPGEPSRTSPLDEQANVAAIYHDVEEIERWLETAAVAENSDTGSEDLRYRLLKLSVDGKEIPARFTTARGHEHEVAAYRLARALGLGLVPPAVPRDVDGKSGAISAWSTTLLNETARAEGEFDRPNRCAIGDDYQLMYVFDALIHNLGRTTDSIRYTAGQKSLWLGDHLETFDTDGSIPDYLRGTGVAIPALLSDRLASLNEARLQDLLGELLSRRQIRAILKRRDEILELWPDAEIEAARIAPGMNAPG
ncbi:MAG: metallophosphoesterase [Gammaproteobacteria bacterium]